MVNAKLSVEAAAATMSPDYTAVDAAVAAAQQRNADLYTTASWSNLTAALNAVDYTLPYLYQPEIDAMAQNINNAIAALVLKTVSYTVEYRLGSESGTKLMADKTGSGSVTTVVNETAAAITGYFAPTATKSITLSLSENKLVFVYFDKPGFSLKLETYKDVGGTPIKTDAVQPGDIITVRVTPTTDFFCGASRFIVMYDKSFYSISAPAMPRSHRTPPTLITQTPLRLQRHNQQSLQRVAGHLFTAEKMLTTSPPPHSPH
jgi:hypothetical protein